MKILFSISSLDSGGAEKVATTLLNEFAKNYEVILVTRKPQSSYFFSLSPQVKIREILDRHEQSRVRKVFNYIFRFSQLIYKEEPDVLISFLSENNILTALAYKLSGISKTRLILSERTDPTQQRLSLLVRFLRRVTYPSADQLVLQTWRVYEWAQSIMFPGHCTVIPNPFSFEELSSKTSNFFVRHPRPYILSVGRLTREKGHDLLIEAFQKISNHVPHDLLIIGDGPEKDNLIGRIEQLDRILILGNKPNIFDYYINADLFVLPSRQEGFPNALGEALLTGIPSISFDCPSGPRELLGDQMLEYLVPAEDVDALAKRIKQVLQDDSSLVKFKDSSKRITTDYSIEKIVTKWVKLFPLTIG